MKLDRDRYFLELALQEAAKALEENTYPVGFENPQKQV